MPSLLDGHTCNAFCRDDIHAVLIYSDATLDDARSEHVPPVGYYSPPATVVDVSLAGEAPPPSGRAAQFFADKRIDLGGVRAFLLWVRADPS